ARREAQLARGLLLQSRGRERSGGATRVGLRLELGYLEARTRRAQCVDEGVGRAFVEGDDVGLECTVVVEVATLSDAATLEARELRGEAGIGIRGGELGDEIPVVGGGEGESLALPVDNEAGGGRLHAAGGETRADLAPQHGRDLE